MLTGRRSEAWAQALARTGKACRKRLIHDTDTRKQNGPGKSYPEGRSGDGRFYSQRNDGTRKWIRQTTEAGFEWKCSGCGKVVYRERGQ